MSNAITKGTFYACLWKERALSALRKEEKRGGDEREKRGEELAEETEIRAFVVQ